MLMFTKLRKVFNRYFASLRWYNIVLALFAYGIASYWLLLWADEEAILAEGNFIYWLVVTGSTVGYGDLSPTTELGKLIVSVFVIPVGLSIFALVIGRIAAWVSAQWHKGVRGLNQMHLDNHIVVIGWNGQRTLHLIDLLQRERSDTVDKPDILLCVRAQMDNPLPGQVEFVHVNSFNKDEDMDRACIADAKVVIIDNPEDDLTMTTALYCSQRNPDAHMLAYFKDESLVKLLQIHCPNVECTPSVAVEMLAKSAFDPGSSLLHLDLLSVETGQQSQFSSTLPASVAGITSENLHNGLKTKYNATFIGFARAATPKNVELNPSQDIEVSGGDKIYYIAEQRLTQVDWQAL